MTTTTTKKYIAPNLAIDESRRELVIETPGDGCYGIFKAPAIYGDQPSDDWNVYLETNGDPQTFPHHNDADCDQIMADLLTDAGVTQEEFEQALGCHWSDWCS